MDPAPPPEFDRPKYTAPTRGVAVASVALGYFSLLVYWWKPFGMCLAAVGFLIGVGCLIAGNKGGPRGENYALAGTAICAVSLGVTITLYSALGYVMWGFAPWPQEWGPQYWFDASPVAGDGR